MKNNNTHTWAYLGLFFFLLSSEVLIARENQLQQHASPYLAMHGEDPVQWQEWGVSAQQMAKRENKLLFISSGYFSCHWCHVMQKESYSDPGIAKLLNDHFIPVKIDRELNPALDARLIEFVERTRGHAGWPLNVFITPEGYPLVGMVYLPPDNFNDLLLLLNEKWQTEQAELKSLAQGAAAELTPPVQGQSAQLQHGLDEHYAQLFLGQVLELADEMQGGFGQQNKFPSVPQLHLLLDIQAASVKPDPQLEKFIHVSLQQMASQGMHDLLAGGFFRYTVDPNWQIPHFEKMLYDNAQLALLYSRASEIMQQAEYLQVAQQTLEFMLNDLFTETVAFAASLSAVDKNGIEGGSYLWQIKDMKQVLNNKEWQLANTLWDFSTPPELEAGYHLRLNMELSEAAQQLKKDEAEIESLFHSMNAKLLEQRKHRRAAKDNKQLAAWNALALQAFLKVGQQTKNKRYIEVATRLHRYLTQVLWDGNQLHRAMINGAVYGQAGLEDYAYTAKALLDFANFTAQAKDYELASQLTRITWEKFYGSQGWQLIENSWLQYGRGDSLLADGVLPSASATLIFVTLQLAKRAQDKLWFEQALKALNVGDAEITAAPFWYASHIRAIRYAQATKK